MHSANTIRSSPRSTQLSKPVLPNAEQQLNGYRNNQQRQLRKKTEGQYNSDHLGLNHDKNDNKSLIYVVELKIHPRKIQQQGRPFDGINQKEARLGFFQSLLMGNTTHYHQRQQCNRFPYLQRQQHNIWADQIQTSHGSVFRNHPTDGQANHRQRPRSRQSSNRTNP